MPRVVASGGRQAAYENFKSAVNRPPLGETPMLLVDSEEPARSPGAWEHLRARDGWTRPPAAGEHQAHLMVQCMESWFLADRARLAAYFGPAFRPAALPANPRIEDVDKSDVLAGLDRAARETAKQGYSKGRDGFKLLALVDPALVEKDSPYAGRCIAALRESGSSRES